MIHITNENPILGGGGEYDSSLLSFDIFAFTFTAKLHIAANWGTTIIMFLFVFQYFYQHKNCSQIYYLFDENIHYLNGSHYWDTCIIFSYF